MKKTPLLLLCIPLTGQAAVFTTGGNIFDAPGGTLVGTYSSVLTAINQNAPSAPNVGNAGGLEYRFGFTSTNAQNQADSTIGVALTLTPAAGYQLDEVTVFQSAFLGGGVNGGFDVDSTTGTGINPGLLTPTYTIAGYGSSNFTFSVGSAGSNTVGTTGESYTTQITTPTLGGADITFDQVPVQLENGAVDDWFVTLPDVNPAGDTVDFSSFMGNTFANEALSFDASFSPVPEPSSALLVGLGGLALLRRRSR